MLSNLLKKKHILSFATKAMLALMLFAVFFAPLQGIAPVAKAQTPPAGVPAGDPLLNGGSAIGGASTGNAPAGGPAGTQTSPNSSNSGGGSTGGGADLDASCWSTSWGICFANVVYVFTVGLMSIFAYIGAFIFDIAVQITLQSVTYSQSFLTISWAAVRDLANMAFIFLLVYLAIIIVLRAETPGALKMLAGVIIAALLINFSFFITRVVVDGGNILATQFYNAIPGHPLSAQADNTAITGSVQLAARAASSNANIKDLTEGIMNVIGVQTFIGSKSFNSFASTLNNSSGHVAGGFSILIILTFIYLAVGAILAMLAFTFITVGVKFLVRVVVLWFVIIAAPLAFVAAAVFKKGSADRFGLFRRWQEALIQFAFYPAVFLFIFWIINLFASQLASSGGILQSTFVDAGNVAGQGAVYTIATAIASVTIRLGIVVIMLFLAMKASDRIASTGVKAVDSLGGKAGGWVSSGMAFAGRNTAGWAGYGFARSNAGRKMAAQGGLLGRTLWRGANKLGSATYDVRNTRTVRAINPLLSNAGTNIGSPTTKNYEAQFGQRVTRRRNEAERLRPNARQLDAAYGQALQNVSAADRAQLENLYSVYLRDQQDFDNGGPTTERQVRQSRTAFENELRRISGQVSSQAGTIAGTNNPTTYANSIDSRSWRNAWGLVRPGGPFITESDREAASQIRGRSGLAGDARLRETLQHVTPAAPTPTPVPPPTPAPTPSPTGTARVTIPPTPPPTPPTPPATPPTPPPAGGAGPRPPAGSGGGARPRSLQQDLNNSMGSQARRYLQDLPGQDAMGRVERRDNTPRGAAPSVTAKDFEKLGEKIAAATQKATDANKDMAREQFAIAQKTFQEQRRQTRATQTGFSTLREALHKPQLSPTIQIEGGMTRGQSEAIHPPQQKPSTPPPPRAIPRPVPPPNTAPIPPTPKPPEDTQQKPPQTA